MNASAQTTFSLATDVSGQRSLKKGQQYWALGQTVAGNFHFTKTDAAYAWLVYYSNGNFSNDLTATAKSPIVTPTQIRYKNEASMRIREVSLGWKHYFKGDCAAEKGISIYGYAGFGLLFGRVTNIQSQNIDTSFYHVDVIAGTGKFGRLTADLGLGVEKPIGGDLFMYADARLYVPASDYPSKYLFLNNNAPLATSLNIGFRILFN